MRANGWQIDEKDGYKKKKNLEDISTNKGEQ